MKLRYNHTAQTAKFAIDYFHHCGTLQSLPGNNGCDLNIYK